MEHEIQEDRHFEWEEGEKWMQENHMVVVKILGFVWVEGTYVFVYYINKNN